VGAREWGFLLGLLACTGDDRPATDSVADTSEGLVRARVESPLAAYPGFGRERDPDRARYRRQEIALHRYIAHCMQQAGFQYTPTPSVVNPPAPRPPALRQDPNERYAPSLTLSVAPGTT
jgi:hypothetical protein